MKVVIALLSCLLTTCAFASEVCLWSKSTLFNGATIECNKRATIATYRTDELAPYLLDLLNEGFEYQSGNTLIKSENPSLKRYSDLCMTLKANAGRGAIINCGAGSDFAYGTTSEMLDKIGTMLLDGYRALGDGIYAKLENESLECK